MAAATNASPPRILLWVFRADLRLGDHPGMHALTKEKGSRYTHLLPLYIFNPRSIETLGFLKDRNQRSPYAPARSRIGNFWRTGPHRVKFLAEGLVNLDENLRKLGSTLVMRVGPLHEVVDSISKSIAQGSDGAKVKGIWMTKDYASEELAEENELRKVAGANDAEFKVFDDNFMINITDLPFKPESVHDIFTQYRKSVEPIREHVRQPLPPPEALPPLPLYIPGQEEPFQIPSSLKELEECLTYPLSDIGIPMPVFPKHARNAHPFKGGEATGHERMTHLLTSGAASSYKDTRNEMLGEDFSTKLSAWLCHGFISPSYINKRLVDLEDGHDQSLSESSGFGKGENKGTAAIRFELLWRDYMRLCMIKFKTKLFSIHGFRDDTSYTWTPLKHAQEQFHRWQTGTTGMGLIDAAQRELVLTGYQSNRARQNVASFLAKHLGIDWRLGAEWFEANLIDYDTASNWGNWNYVAGVGNDPRNDRKFNPVKQASDYDSEGRYIKTWVEELSDVEDINGIFQAWKLSDDDKKRVGGVALQNPLVRIEWGDGKSRGGGGGQRSGGRYGGSSRGAGRGGFRGRGRGKGHQDRTTVGGKGRDVQ